MQEHFDPWADAARAKGLLDTDATSDEVPDAGAEAARERGLSLYPKTVKLPHEAALGGGVVRRDDRLDVLTSRIEELAAETVDVN